MNKIILLTLALLLVATSALRFRQDPSATVETGLPGDSSTGGDLSSGDLSSGDLSSGGDNSTAGGDSSTMPDNSTVCEETSGDYSYEVKEGECHVQWADDCKDWQWSEVCPGHHYDCTGDDNHEKCHGVEDHEGGAVTCNVEWETDWNTWATHDSWDCVHHETGDTLVGNEDCEDASTDDEWVDKCTSHHAWTHGTESGSSDCLSEYSYNWWTYEEEEEWFCTNDDGSTSSGHSSDDHENFVYEEDECHTPAGGEECCVHSFQYFDENWEWQEDHGDDPEGCAAHWEEEE